MLLEGFFSEGPLDKEFLYGLSTDDFFVDRDYEKNPDDLLKGGECHGAPGGW